MLPSFRTIAVKVTSEDGTQVDGLASFEYEYDVRDGRGHGFGQLWVKAWPAHMNESGLFSLKRPDGSSVNVYLTRISFNLELDGDGNRELNAWFIEEANFERYKSE